jgi:hypothetical protein
MTILWNPSGAGDGCKAPSTKQSVEIIYRLA